MVGGGGEFKGTPGAPASVSPRPGIGPLRLRPERLARPFPQQKALERFWAMTAWLLDTGPLVAFFDRSDACHEWAREQWAQAPVPFLTCEPVLAEATYLLREHAGLRGDKVLALFERKVIAAPFRLE